MLYDKPILKYDITNNVNEHYLLWERQIYTDYVTVTKVPIYLKITHL